MNRNVIGDVIASEWKYVETSLNSWQIRTLHAIRQCRTPALGGHLYRCTNCDKLHHRYNSCRNRHCSQCQNTQKERWIEARQNQFIKCPYYHLVFTLPSQINEICLVYPRQLYALLMRCAWQTILDFGWNNKYLGAQTGAIIVLHTWGSNMSFHPHVHCIVPGGGVSISGKWKTAKAKGKFLFPVKAMSIVFKAKFMDGLYELLDEMGLDNTGKLFQQLVSKKWVVYAKSPFGGKEGLVKYLARYTHNIAISHHRILDHSNRKITFRYKDYRHANKTKSMTLSTQEFVRRLAMHILPKGFLPHSSLWYSFITLEIPHVSPFDDKAENRLDRLLEEKGTRHIQVSVLLQWDFILCPSS